LGSSDASLEDHTMKNFLVGLCAVLLGAVLVVNDVEAKRLGGGRSVGTQRSVTAPPASTPAKPAQQQAAPGAQQAAPGAAAAAPAASGLSRWLPMLGGLALGGLLGSMFGGSGGFGGILLIALLALGAVVAFRAFTRRRETAAPVQFAGMGGRETVTVPPASSLPETSFQKQPAQAAGIPAGFDVAGFVRGAKLNFIKLQAANDTGKLDEIREFTTVEMFDELSKDAKESGAQETNVVTLDADLLEVTTEGGKHWASVRFSGTVREAPGAAAEGFEEVWNLVKPADGSSGWLLSGIQQMQ
jgi:predicted lipid-binding transport protein (Tim44 family)